MRSQFLGVPVDVLTLDETLAIASEAMRSRQRCQHVALNVAKFVGMRRNPELWRDVVESDLIGIDGMGIVWGGRLMGIKIPSRVAGIDLFERLVEVCAREGFRPYFLGAREDILERLMFTMKTRWPTLLIAGSQHGYFSTEDEELVVSAIRGAAADCLFIALPTPRKERLLAKFRDRLGVPFIMGVGGSFDVVAGAVKRASPAMQQFGLEWFHRLIQEPRRMFWRYASTNLEYGFILIRALLAKTLLGRK